MSIYSKLEGLYVERAEIIARRDKIIEERGYNGAELEYIYRDLDYTDELVVLDDDLFIVQRAIDEIEWSLELERLGMTEEEYIEAESEQRNDKYYSANRCEMLVNRFFNILEEGGQWTEMFLIRDLLMDEYITHGGCTQVEIIQIDDIIEEALERELEANEPVIEMYYLDDVVNNIYKAIERGDLDGAFALTNAYGDNAQSNPYIYYCVVRELERVTGETLIELCL
jgi:hypothetical protein